jgi:hypothetical protein
MDKLSSLFEANRFAGIFGVATREPSIQVKKEGAAADSTQCADNCGRQSETQVDSPASSLQE